MDLLALRRLLARPIAYHKLFGELAGGACPGLFLSQLWYWADVQERTQPEAKGWFYKTLGEWYEETGLSKRELETARKLLQERKFLTWSERGFGSQKRLYWRLNTDVVLAAMSDFLGQKVPTPATEPNLSYREPHILQNGKYENPVSEDMRIPLCDFHTKEHRLHSETTSKEVATQQKKIGGAGLKVSNLSSPTPTPLKANDVVQLVPPVAPTPQLLAGLPVADQIAKLEEARTRLSGESRRKLTKEIALLKQKLAVVLPWGSVEFEQAWADWEAHKRKKRTWYASNVTEQKQLDALHKLVDGDEARAVLAIGHSIGKNYEGVYEERPPQFVQSSYTPAPLHSPTPTQPSQVLRRAASIQAVADLDRAQDMRSHE